MRTRDKCPLCGAPTAEAKLYVKTQNGYDVHQCPACTLVFGKDILDEGELFTIYDDAYVGKYEERPLAEQNRGYADRFFGHKPRGRVLEVGCGTGQFLRRLSELGFDAFGVEVSPACAAYAADLRVVIVPFEEMPEVRPAARFDYVVTFHVLEHVVEPVTVVRKVATLLKDDGVWFNYMPNVRARGRRIQIPSWIHFNPPNVGEHVNFFDGRTIRVLAREAGLEIYLMGTLGDDFWSEARRRRVTR